MADRVLSISCSGYRLETRPSKHFSYELRIKWPDRETVVYRRYSQFFNMQCTLLDSFPIEAGTYNPERRIIPFLPGKKFIGNLTSKTAEKRKAKLDVYVKNLLDITSIAQSQTFLDFCKTKDKDLERLTKKEDQSTGTAGSCVEISEPLLLPQYRAVFDYKKCQKGEMSISVGDILLVIDKKHTGWWLVQSEEFGSQGWVPASFLQPVNPLDAESDHVTAMRAPDKYIAICDYMASNSDELSVRLGAYVDVYTKSVDGWWTCSVKGKRGLLPAAYLCKVNSAKARTLKAQMEKSQPERPEFRRPLSKYAPPRQISASAKKVRPPRPPPPKLTQEYLAIADFVGDSADSVNLIEGDNVQVITKDDSGWWYVCTTGKKGWAPSTYLKSKQSS